MAKKIFITSTERRSGKSLFTLGLMTVLERIVPRVGYMKPIGQGSLDGTSIDEDALLIKRVFDLDDDVAHLSPMGMEQARQDKDALFERIFECYNIVSADKDVMVLEGTDYTSSLSALEFDINAELAQNLVAPVMLVVNGYQKGIPGIAQSVRECARSFEEQGCTLLGAVVNRYDSKNPAEDSDRLSEAIARQGVRLFGIILHNPLLSGPRLREVADRLGARVVYQGDDLSKVVTDTRILAMTPENALAHIKERDGYLIITPGDRSEHVFTVLSAQRSSHFPQYSGIVLTGGLPLGFETRDLIEGLDDVDLSILSVADDTFRTALQVHEVTGGLRADDSEKIDLARRSVERYVNIDAIHEQLGTFKTDVVTPRMFQYRILETAKANQKRIVLPEGTEPRILKAAEEVLLRGVCDVILLGDKDEIGNLIQKNHLSIDDSKIFDFVVDEATREDYGRTLYELRKHKGVTVQRAVDAMLDPVVYAAMMVYKGKADGYVSGATHSTADTLRPVLQIIRTKPEVSLASSVFFMCMPSQVIVYGDCALVSNPSAEELADIAITSAQTAREFGIEPVVAMLSYSTGESGSGTDVDRVRKATEIVREKRPDIPIEGPIQYDAATSIEVAALKAKGSNAAGKATVYIFPDLDAGNTAYKAVQRAANVPAIGPVMQGLNKPANDLSRGASVTDIVYTIAVTAIQAQHV